MKAMPPVIRAGHKCWQSQSADSTHAEPVAQDVFVALQIYPQYGIHGCIFDSALTSELDVNGIQEKDGINSG
jgi:hypothetical protein